MPRLLFIAYYFPPLGGPASIRLSKTVNYLHKLGWDIDVITVKNILYHSTDEHLLNKVQNVRIHRVPSLEVLSLFHYLKRLSDFFALKGNQPCDNNKKLGLYFRFSDKIRGFGKRLFVPDEKIGWGPAVIKKATSLLRTKKYNLIYSSIGPYTSAIIAHRLGTKFKIPYVVEYRDHWSLNPYEKAITKLHQKIAHELEKEVLESAAHVVTIGETMREELLLNFPLLARERTSVVYNGYDEQDFSDIESHSELQNNVTFSYFGNLYGQRTPKYLLKAIEELSAEQVLPENVKFRFVGNYHADVLALFTADTFSNIIDVVPQIPHREAIKEMVKSDVLLLFIPSQDGRGVLTSKIFEYLRAGRPILAMIPEDSELKTILAEGHDIITMPMEDIKGIKKGIVTFYKKVVESNVQKNYTLSEISKYSRETQTANLNKTLLRLINSEKN